MSFPDLPRNPCGILGLSLEQGAEIIAAILVTLKGIYLMAIMSGWAALGVGWKHSLFNNSRNPITENLFRQDVYDQMPWLFIDVALSFLTDWLLLAGVWRKNRTMCYVWMCTNTLKGFREVFLGPQRRLANLLFGVLVGLYEYWVIWAYSEELERLENEGLLIGEYLPLPLNALCTIAFLLEVYFIFWNPISISHVVILSQNSTQ